jgi:hypothetical protein
VTSKSKNIVHHRNMHPINSRGTERGAPRRRDVVERVGEFALSCTQIYRILHYQSNCSSLWSMMAGFEKRSMTTCQVLFLSRVHGSVAGSVRTCLVSSFHIAITYLPK